MELYAATTSALVYLGLALGSDILNVGEAVFNQYGTKEFIKVGLILCLPVSARCAQRVYRGDASSEDYIASCSMR